MNYTPKVGDRVRRPSWSDGVWIEIYYIDGDTVYGRDRDGDPACWGADGVWLEVQPRPTVAECWGLIDENGRFDRFHSEDSARDNQHPDVTLARIRHKRALIHVGDDHVNWITVAVVCDEHGIPIEVAE